MLRKFKLEDLDNFVPQKEQCFGSEWDRNLWIQYYLRDYEMITGEDESGVVGFCAFVPDGSGNETVCMVTQVGIKKLLREIIPVFKMMYKQRLAKRTQAFIKKGWDAASRFAIHFGFSYEGTLRNLGCDGEDYDVYSMIRERKKA